MGPVAIHPTTRGSPLQSTNCVSSMVTSCLTPCLNIAVLGSHCEVLPVLLPYQVFFSHCVLLSCYDHCASLFTTAFRITALVLFALLDWLPDCLFSLSLWLRFCLVIVHWLASSLCLLSTNKLVCGGHSETIWLPSHHPGGCCTLVVVEEIPPFYVKHFEYPEKHYINVTNNECNE